jgi:HAD superfamily hydrolase (TIGR01509 family)
MAQTNLLKVAFFDIGDTLVDSNKKWIPGAKKLLDELRSRHIRLGLITNTGALTRADVLKLLPPSFNLQLFEPELVIMSSEVGFEKPDPKIFKLAIKRAGVKADRCLFCTEDAAHTAVAASLGMRAEIVKPPPAGNINQVLKKLIAAGLVPNHVPIP